MPSPSAPRSRRPLRQSVPNPGDSSAGASGSAIAARNRVWRGAAPWSYLIRRKSNEFFRRLLRRPRSVSEGPNLLPLLIRVLACFSKLDGKILEEEIDSSLGFPASRLPGGRLFRVAQGVPAGAQRAARPRFDRRQAQFPAQPRPQNPPGHPALGPHLPRGPAGRPGRRLLQVHGRHRHDRPGHRHRLPAQRLGIRRPRRVPERGRRRSNRSPSAPTAAPTWRSGTCPPTTACSSTVTTTSS